MSQRYHGHPGLIVSAMKPITDIQILPRQPRWPVRLDPVAPPALRKVLRDTTASTTEPTMEAHTITDMEQGRSRIPFERGHVGIHSLSAAAIEDVAIGDGEDKPIWIEITMNNSAGIYQVDGLLKAKLRGSGLEPYVEVLAHIDTEAEKRLVPLYRLE